MSPIITLLVLAAAVMHASWNALIKAGNDKVVMQCLVMFFAGVPCLPFLLFIPLPAPASWPFLALSLAVHGVYYVTLINAYRFGALSQVYPIARGAAPLMIALGAWAFAGESMSPLEWAGVIIASAGIMSLAAPGKLPREEELKAIGFALATSITIALYSIADGIGVRRAGGSPRASGRTSNGRSSAGCCRRSVTASSSGPWAARRWRMSRPCARPA